MQSSQCGLLVLVEVPKGLSYFHSYYKFILNVLERENNKNVLNFLCCNTSIYWRGW